LPDIMEIVELGWTLNFLLSHKSSLSFISHELM
jgi:hypothetical protein